MTTEEWLLRLPQSMDLESVSGSRGARGLLYVADNHADKEILDFLQ
jgi:hypothetical protein